MKRLWMMLIIALPLSSCGLWVQYTQPETPQPSAWQTAPDAAAWPDAQWWEQFGAPELTAMMQEAQTANFDIQAAIARVRQADAQVRVAGASLLPTVNLSGAVSKNQQTLSSSGASFASGAGALPVVVGGRSRQSDVWNTRLNASYELDFWGKNSSAAIAAEATADASRYDAQTVRMTVQASVANTYFDAIATKARLETAQRNYANAKEVLDAIRKRYEVGVATELDVAQQENVVSAQNVAIAPLELQLRKDQDALAILLGKLPEAVAMPSTALDAIAIPLVVAGLPSELLLRRPDVQFAEAQLIAADANIVNARAQFFPSISLTGQAGYQSETLKNLFQPDSMLWSIGSSLAQPIFEGGALFGNLEANKARYDELLHTYRKAVIASFSDVEDALATVTQTAAQEKEQQAATRSARRAYELAQQQFKGGIIDITTVLDTQRTVFAAEDQMLAFRLAHLNAIVGLYNALGGGWHKLEAQ